VRFFIWHILEVELCSLDLLAHGRHIGKRNASATQVGSGSSMPTSRPPRIKQQRKIFFTLAWLNAFIGGQQTVEADQVVREWLATANIDAGVRLKVLQVVDDLDRTVKIRAQFR